MGDPPRGTLIDTKHRLEQRFRPSASAACWAAGLRRQGTMAPAKDEASTTAMHKSISSDG
jgi:hypothetical protein